MIAIVNVSDEDAPLYGKNKYELRINSRVICEFEHDRKMGNLSQCLRDAADAHDKHQAQKKEIKIENILELVKSLDSNPQK